MSTMPRITSPSETVDCPDCHGNALIPSGDTIAGDLIPCPRCSRSGRVYEPTLTAAERAPKKTVTVKDLHRVL